MSDTMARQGDYSDYTGVRALSAVVGDNGQR
jgi:hypothetical protein